MFSRVLSHHGGSVRLLRTPNLLPGRTRLQQFSRPRPPLRTYYQPPSKFQPFVPPNPSSLPKPRPPRRIPRVVTRTTRGLLTVSGVLFGLYLADRYLNYSTFVRTLRTIFVSLLVSADYKLTFRSPTRTAEELSALHSRNADRIVNLCVTNGGLYQKIGQALAMQSALLPKEFQDKFALFFDNTPAVGIDEVEKVLRAEYPNHRDPLNQIFVPGSFDKVARGSASVAQVHRAQLASTGEWVAVKIQKPGIRRQTGWDLWVFRIVMIWLSEKAFGLPLGFMVPYICERMQSETDFLIEKENAELSRLMLQRDFGLEGWVGGPGGVSVGMADARRRRGRVYIPKIYHELCTERVMIAEWIDGVSLSSRETLTSPPRTPRQVRAAGGKPGGLGLDPDDIMHTILTLFAHMTFHWGHVHCDPHPGNILVRAISPNNPPAPITPHMPPPPREARVPEIILLDHGLYVHLSPQLRSQYARLWKGLVSFDISEVTEITEGWGFGSPELVASMTVLRPWRPGKRSGGGHGAHGGGDMFDSPDGTDRPPTAYEQHMKAKEMLATSLAKEDKVPRELPFLGRCMRILQGNNQLLSSPTNRLKLLALSASASLLPGGANYPLSVSQSNTVRARMPNTVTDRLGRYLATYVHHVMFRFTLFMLDLSFWWSRFKVVWLGGRQGFEDEIEERMRRVAKEEFGMDIQGGVFQG